ncbi:TMEM175 family protein [Flavobacterium sp. WC2421]|uniref:TMEM175 family protein n=2 Tax=unclassified Flavobacterium TaxID=196869 RepID=A0AB39W8X7_9FLAO
MNKNRLEAFSDGVLAIIITIMILEIKAPEGKEFQDLISVYPKFLSYVLSFLYIGIYWNNHHHLLQGLTKVNGKMLWANLHLLFWLSLIPFSTAWMGENYFSKSTMTLYGIILMFSAIAFNLLQTCIVKTEGVDSLVGKATKNDLKGKLSIVLYILGIIISFFNQWISGVIYLIVAFIWLVPDTRIEKSLIK